MGKGGEGGVVVLSKPFPLAVPLIPKAQTQKRASLKRDTSDHRVVQSATHTGQFVVKH
jgi:hypothetical protein